MTIDQRVEELRDWLRAQFNAEISHFGPETDPDMRHRFQIGPPYYRELYVQRRAIDDLESPELIEYMRSRWDKLELEDLEITYDPADGLGDNIREN